MNLEFGKNFKKLRRERDLTQEELAEKLSLSPQAISRYETGSAYPDIEMLPVIAGFFGTTIDKLLGVSGEAKEKRKDEYIDRLRMITDHRERLALLKKQRAEFPEDWDVVSDIVYEMTHIPECLEEMRKIIDDGMMNCHDMLWRENMMLFYLECESDDEKANKFIEKHSSRYDMRKVSLLETRYSARKEYDKLKRVRQKMLIEKLEYSLYKMTERIPGDIQQSKANCQRVLDFIKDYSLNNDETKPDMWFDVKLQVMLRLANNSFMLEDNEGGFEVLEKAVTLFENFFALPEKTLLTYGTPIFDSLSAFKYKEIFQGITQFSGVVAKSTMIFLVYKTPVGYVDPNPIYGYDMEGFERTMVFSEHTYNVLNSSGWDGFDKVKDDPKYITLKERVRQVSDIKFEDNLLFLMDSARKRNDDYVKDKRWVCALLVEGVGAYMIYDHPDDIEKKFNEIKREGNSLVYQVAAVEFGGGYIYPPDIVVKKLIEMNSKNENAKVIMPDSAGGVDYIPLTNLP